MMISLFLLTMIFFLSKLNIHSSSHNCPIEMRLEWRLGNISAYFAWLDNCFIAVWAWCVDAIVDELGSFTLIDFSGGSVVWTIVVRAYMWCPVHTESDIGSYFCGCGGD